MEILAELIGKRAAKKSEQDFYGWNLFHPPLPRRNHARRAYTEAEYRRKLKRDEKRAMPSQDRDTSCSASAPFHKPRASHVSPSAEIQTATGGLRLSHRPVKMPPSVAVSNTNRRVPNQAKSSSNSRVRFSEGNLSTRPADFLTERTRHT